MRLGVSDYVSLHGGLTPIPQKLPEMLIITCERRCIGFDSPDVTTSCLIIDPGGRSFGKTVANYVNNLRGGESGTLEEESCTRRSRFGGIVEGRDFGFGKTRWVEP